MTSRFAAKQLVFAHAALTDVQGRKLWHDQRIAREGFEVALAAQGDTRVRLRDWSLERAGGWLSRAHARRRLRAGPALQRRPSRCCCKASRACRARARRREQASYYYSQPQLAVRGALALQGRRFDVAGKAWLDHEWSEELLHPEAVGWDWIGMNLDDGSALTAFRLRRQDGTALWDGGSFRSARRRPVHLQPRRSRRSARSAAGPVPSSRRELSGGMDRAHAGRLLHASRP